jgi:hypothetical protein
MKLTYMVPLACAALLCATTIANTQTSPSSSNSSAQSGTDNPSPGSNTKGNNLDTSSKSPKVDSMSAPPSTGQDKSTGNNMVAPNGKDSSTPSDSSMSQSSASHPDFSTLDTKKSGKLTAADVKSNQWLSKNFAKCDTDHDGSIDKAEYNACH